MEALIHSALRALRSLATPGMLVIFIISVAATMAALTGFVIFAGVFFNWLAGDMPGHEIIARFLPWLGSIGAFFVAWLLFPGIMPVIISFFDERIARVIERQDYPASQSTHKPAFWPELMHDLRFSFVIVALNILVLPLYLLPLFNLVLFYLLNGYLLGREFFVMAARRHMAAHEAEALRKRHNGTVMAAGIALAALATIPIVNFFAPFWGVAVMVHLYHRLSNSPVSELLPPE